jgi:hypothetical protein
VNPEPEKPAANTPDARVEELMIRYWDGALDERGLAELNAALAARPEWRSVFNELCLQVVTLGDRAAAQRLNRPKRWRLRPRTAGLVAVAALVVFAILAVWFGGTPSHSPGPSGDVARLVNAVGMVVLGNDAGEGQPVTADQALTAGPVISTVGLQSSAEILCRDGTRLILGGETSVSLPQTLAGPIHLLQGDLAADPQRRSVQIATPEAEVRAQGAKVALTRAAQTTLVGVTAPTDPRPGEVQLTRVADGRTVALRPGEVAATRGDEDLRPRLLPPPPDDLLVTFGKELPHGWGAGNLVFDNLPAGSEAAVRAVPRPTPRGQLFHKVQSQKDWTNGLFTIHDDTQLHVRFRVEKPGFFHILVVTRTPDPTERMCVVLEGPDIFKDRQAGHWYTAHVPFSAFKPTDARKSDQKPLVAFLVLFDSQVVDRGLTIERYWITRGPAPE